MDDDECKVSGTLSGDKCAVGVGLVGLVSRNVHLQIALSLILFLCSLFPFLPHLILDLKCGLVFGHVDLIDGEQSRM